MRSDFRWQSPLAHPMFEGIRPLMSASSTPEFPPPPQVSHVIKNWFYVSRVFHVSSELLAGKSLDEVGLMAYTDNQEPLMLNVLLGNVQVLSSDDPTLEPMSVSDITCDKVIIDNLSTRSDQAPSEQSGAKCISMELRWTQPEVDANVTSYHIWWVKTCNLLLSMSSANICSQQSLGEWVFKL